MMDNIEAIVIQYLNARISGWTTYADAPSTLPEKFILVDRTGGGREFIVKDASELLVEIYHKTSRLEASNMAHEVADVLTDMVEIDNVIKVSINSIVQLGDTIRQYNRYQVYSEIGFRR